VQHRGMGLSEDARQDSRHLGDPGTADFQVERYPFYLLNRTVGRYNTLIEQQLRTIGLDVPYWRVLMILGETMPLGVNRIAEAAVINLSTMMRIIQRMERDKLVRSAPSRGDARVTEVSLTAAGKKKLAEARAITAPIYATVIGGFSERDFDRLTALLNKLHDNLGKLR
jgi:DNA-binding MarR family transcriptional regulator